jgi:hypothetical protein
VPAQPAEIGLSAGILADLPPESLQELSQTMLLLDRESTLEVIEHTAEDTPETAAELRALVEKVQMGAFEIH